MRHFRIRESVFRFFSRRGGEAMRKFIVAMGRSRRHLPFVWAGAESTEYVTALGSTVERKTEASPSAHASLPPEPT